MRHTCSGGIALVIASGLVSGCLLNSVHQITTDARSSHDSNHAIVVIGLGLDEAWPYNQFGLTLPEYSVKKQEMTGNCFHYNRIEAFRPSNSEKITYLAFEVPPSAYAFPDTADNVISSALVGNAFMAPANTTVYFGDFIVVGNKKVEFRRDIEAARVGAAKLLPSNAVLELAETTAAPGAHIPLCTPLTVAVFQGARRQSLATGMLGSTPVLGLRQAGG